MIDDDFRIEMDLRLAFIIEWIGNGKKTRLVAATGWSEVINYAQNTLPAEVMTRENPGFLLVRIQRDENYLNDGITPATIPPHCHLITPWKYNT